MKHTLDIFREIFHIGLVAGMWKNQRRISLVFQYIAESATRKTRKQGKYLLNYEGQH